MKKLLLTTSLVITMAFSGAATANSDWYGKEGQSEKAFYMDNALSKLPAQKAADFRATMKDSRDENKDLQEQVYRLHGELHAILTAPEFNKEEFLAKRAEVQRLHNKMENNRTEAFASAVSELSQNERVTLTRALHHEHGKQHHRHARNGNMEIGTPATTLIKH